uniref:Uncharacterized protein n=1 Tax=Rhodnius prolixus TaxID=13249 RepID=T1HXQ6_RHOPR
MDWNTAPPSAPIVNAPPQSSTILQGQGSLEYSSMTTLLTMCYLWKSIMCCSNVIVGNKVFRPLPLQGLEGEERRTVALEEDWDGEVVGGAICGSDSLLDQRQKGFEGQCVCCCYVLFFTFYFQKFDFVFGSELENSQIRFEYWFCEDGMQVGRKWTFRFDDCIPQFVPIILVTIAIEDQVVGVYNCISRHPEED